jgi:hypothetical protein
MEQWEFDFKWLRVRHYVKECFNKEVLPDLNAILFVIGLQELGFWAKKITKEDKEALMHIAVCSLLSNRGYYEFEGRDADGWPHWKVAKRIDITGVKGQERILQEEIIDYFSQTEEEE